MNSIPQIMEHFLCPFFKLSQFFERKKSCSAWGPNFRHYEKRNAEIMVQSSFAQGLKLLLF